jgi:Cu/Ag efflux pump CusA
MFSPQRAGRPACAAPASSTPGGLAIAIGVVVDDAVIGVEHIVRRLRENRRSSEPRPFARIVLDATLEVRSAVVYATLAVILVVLPVMTLSGTVGRLFAPLGLAYTMAVLASLVVALTVTPALSMALLPGRVPARGSTRDPMDARRLSGPVASARGSAAHALSRMIRQS